MLQTKIENIPSELRALTQWVCWYGADKIPKNPKTGGNAMANNPDTWGTFDQAVEACAKYKFDGIGFEFAPPYFGVDLDHCTDNLDFVDEFVETLQSYAEFSKSGTGIHIICKGKLPDGARRKNNVEMYSTGRYFIFTGNIYNEKYKKIVDCTETIKVLHSKYLPSSSPSISTKRTSVIVDLSDQEVIDKARNCKTGSLFTMLYAGNWEGLYTSQSEADIAFCNQLAFWTGRNETQMDRIFRSSGLLREKWDKKRGSDTYGIWKLLWLHSAIFLLRHTDICQK
jgi:putative DNA primase/helicase